jgi:transcriptional regulator with XRE-family HTH domain
MTLEQAFRKNFKQRFAVIENKTAWCDLHDLSKTSVYGWIHGKSRPTLSALYKASRALGCTMEDLIEGAEL